MDPERRDVIAPKVEPLGTMSTRPALVDPFDALVPGGRRR
jgi:hypothetical protein